MTEQEHHSGISINDVEIIGVTYTTNPMPMKQVVVALGGYLLLVLIVALVLSWRGSKKEA